MAMKLFKEFEFDGESSKSFGVYITGKTVHNAPKREVEMISIPGRNGDLAIDQGRYENIDITYTGGIFAQDELAYSRAVAELRNYLCSKVGYCRLTDDYNPDEYRLAVYKSGLDVETTQRKAGEFEITFDCKPQRYLMSGEVPVNVSDGDTLLNPTLHASSPLLAIEGYGTVGFNGHEIELYGETLGEVTLWDAESFNASMQRETPAKRSYSIPSLLNIGDSFKISGLTYSSLSGGEVVSDSPINVNSSTGTSSGVNGVVVTPIISYTQSSGRYRLEMRMSAEFPSLVFVYGTPKTYTDVETVTCVYDTSGTIKNQYVTTVEYDGADTVIFRWGLGPQYQPISASLAVTVPRGEGYSSIILTDDTTYIDCDLGETYKVMDGKPYSLNSYIDLGSNLPTLAPGENEITYDNTIDSLEITPRWWQL